MAGARLACPCCAHCDPGDDWHVSHGRGAHRDPCPDGCGSARDSRAVHLVCGGAGISPRCGNPRWSQATSAEGDVTCRTCLNLLDGTHHVGVRPYDVEPCGTPAAYRRHLRHEGKPVRCLPCLRAEARRNEDDRKARTRHEGEVLAA